jgi:DNA-binding transcriptional regulator LsrR (DeoR family)
MHVDQHRLLGRIARLYYERDLTQLEISRRLRLSRQKVQRLLQQARERGVVRISIAPVVGTFADLEEGLESRFDLREAVVVETATSADQESISREIGTAAADYLLRVLQPQERVVISWGGTVKAMVDALARASRTERAEGTMVIQGLGGLGDPGRESHASDLTRRMARSLGATPVLLPAPGVAGTRDARNAFCKDDQVSRALRAGQTATIAVMGIGVPRRDSVLLTEGSIVSWNELRQLQSSGAVGDINLRYFDARGRAVRSAIDDRVVGLSLAEIRQVPHVVGIAGGAAKFDAIRAALTGGLLHVLITDHTTARRLADPPR